MTTLEEIKSGNSSRAMHVAIKCLEHGITDPDTIAGYIEKSYTTPSTEFPGKNVRGQGYIKRLTNHTFRYLREQGVIKDASAQE